MDSQLHTIITVSTILLLASCSEKSESTAKPSQHSITFDHKPQQKTVESKSVETNRLFDEQPASAELSKQSIATTPKYTIIGQPEPFHYSDVRRFSLRIRVERGHTHEEIEHILHQAALDIRVSRKADAVDVLAFAPGDDSSGIATVGKGVLAPDGRWSDAAKQDPFKFQMEFFSDIYFKSDLLISDWKPGDELELWGIDDKTIRLSKTWDSWGAGSEVASVPPGTHAIIVQKHIEPLVNGTMMTCYQVEVLLDGATIRGWVSQSAVEGHAAP